MNAPVTTALADGWAIGDIEPALSELRATIGILGHMIDSPNEVTIAEWKTIEDRLTDAHNQLDDLWRRAWDERTADEDAHAAALAAAEARTAAPGSVADLERADSVWCILRSTAKVALQACEEARPALTGKAPT
jgi:hypothetical protein